MPDEPDSVRVNLWMNELLYRRLFDDAKAGQVTIAYLIRKILMDWKTGVPKGTWFLDPAKWGE